MKRLNWGAWLYGLWVAVVGGAAGAVTSAIGVSLLDPAKYNLGSPSAIHDVVRLVLVVFTINAVIVFFAYLAKHPAPEWDGTPVQQTFEDKNGVERIDRRGISEDKK